MPGKYVAPSFKLDGFHCPYCGTFAHQKWYLSASAHSGADYSGYDQQVGGLSASVCSRCNEPALWVGKELIFPGSSVAPLPVEDMPQDVKEDFAEARNVVNASPRAAAALLRLALQKLISHLGERGEDLNDDIANLVKKGLPEKIQKALDSVRVIGNNAVHPGQIDLRDDPETTIRLFELVNMVVEVMITQPKKVDELYSGLPGSSKEQIRKRDKKI